MRCETTADAAAFWDLASGFLLRDPVVNSVMLTGATARRDGVTVGPAPATYAAVLDDGGAVVGAAMRTPPFGIYVSPMPSGAIAPLADEMVSICPDAPGVSGTTAEAEAFASAWVRRTATTAVVVMRQRIHRLDAVTVPAAPPGRWRPAGPSDRDLLVGWSEAFQRETGAVERGVAADVDTRLAQRRAFVWIDGAVVSYTGTSMSVASFVRVGPVYTPPERRGRGYATALVAAVSQHALDAGAVACSLYTDLDNPTSNRIYAAVGYRPVCDVDVYRFS